MTKESEWVDYGMLLDEIHLHRSNAQRQINEYREKGKERDLTKSEYGLYNEEVGKEIALMCLERWCMDFKFSISEIKEMEVIQAEKKLPEGLEKAAGEYAVDNAQYYYEDDSDAICSTADILKPAFIAGAEWQKAKMMEEAVEGRIGQIGLHNSIYIKEPKWCDTLDKFNNGDKVRVIIIKEDE